MYLLLAQCTVNILERIGICRIHPFLLTTGSIIRIHQDIILVQLHIIMTVAADGHARIPAHRTMQRLCRIVSCRNRINDKLRTRQHIAANKDLRIIRLISQAVSHRIIAMMELHRPTFQQAAPVNALTDGEDNSVARNCLRFLFIVLRRETLGFRINDLRALLEDDTGHVICLIDQNLLGTPAVNHINTVFQRLLNLCICCRHRISLLQRNHGNLISFAALRITRTVNRNVATADNNNSAAHIRVTLGKGLLQIMDRNIRTDCIIMRNARTTAALAADGNIERLVTLLLQLGQCHIFAHFDAAFDFDTLFTDDIDFLLQHILLQLVGRDAVHHHAAGLFVFLKDGRMIAHHRQVERTRQSRRTGANDRNLIIEIAVHVRNNLLGKQMFHTVQIKVSDKFLNRINRYRRINRPACAGIFAALIADTAADSRERILRTNEPRSLLILPFLCLGKICLDRNMGRARRLAGGGSRRIGVMHTGRITVVFIPCILAPLDRIRKHRLRIGLFTAILMAQLLSKLNSTRRTAFNTKTAGNTLGRIRLRRKGAAGKIRRIKQHAGTQRIADLHITVADIEDMLRTIDIGNLVNEAVILCFLQNIQRLFRRNIMGAAGFDGVIRHVANLNAPVIRIIAAAFAQHRAGITAGTDSGRKMTLIFLQPVRDMLQIHGLIIKVHFLFYRNDMHANAITSRRNHLRNTSQRNKCHPLKEVSNRGILINTILARVEEFRRSRHKIGYAPALGMRLVRKRVIMVIAVAVIVLQNTDPAHLVQQFLQVRRLNIRCQLHHLFKGIELSKLHAVGQGNLLIIQYFAQTPVFRIIRLNAGNLMRNNIRNFTAKLCECFVALFFILVDGARLFKLFRHVFCPFLYTGKAGTGIPSRLLPV